MTVLKSDRMIGVFGHREMEVAAIEIVDVAWKSPLVHVAVPYPTGTYDIQEFLVGLLELKSGGWITYSIQKDRQGPYALVQASEAFWKRVLER